jgi:hypothetical protein
MNTLGPEQLGDYPRHFSSPNATMSECALQSSPCVNSTLRWLVSPASATVAQVQLLNNSGTLPAKRFTNQHFDLPADLLTDQLSYGFQDMKWKKQKICAILGLFAVRIIVFLFSSKEMCTTPICLIASVQLILGKPQSSHYVLNRRFKTEKWLCHGTT